MRPMGVDDARSFIKVILALILKAQVAITASVYGEYPRVEGAVMFRGLTLCLHLAPWMIDLTCGYTSVEAKDKDK